MRQDAPVGDRDMASKSVATKTVATKAKAAPPKDGEPRRRTAHRKRTPETPDAPLPLLDLSDAAVKKMIKPAKKRGYVTYEQLNAVMPSEEVTSEKIEDILAMMNEMGINVVETEEAEADDEEEAREEADEEESRSRGELVEVTAEAARQIRGQGAGRAHRRSGAHVSARNGLGGAALARGRNRHRQAHRGRPRGHDRRPLRKPADVPGRHHLARRVERRQGLPPRHHRSRSDLCGPRRQAGAPAVPPGDGRPHAPAANGRGRAPASCRSRRRRWRRRRRRPPPRRSSRAVGNGAAAGEARPAKKPRISRRRPRRGRSREFDVARRDRGRAQAESARDLRQHRRRLQAAAPPARARHPGQAARTRRCRRRRSASRRSSRKRSSRR